MENKSFLKLEGYPTLESYSGLLNKTVILGEFFSV